MTDLKNKIATIQENFLKNLANAKNEQDMENLRLKFLSRNGEIFNLMHILKEMPLEEKKVYGPLLNELKKATQEVFDNKLEQINKDKLNAAAKKQIYFDVTAYKPKEIFGSLHPYTTVTQQIEDIFISMGYEIADGPEVETEFHNFEALNIPADHPARDMQDTFWLTLPGLLMRTHTSSVEVHTMKNRKPPIAIVAPGRCYRNEATDASHDFMFMQAEGLFIDKNVSLANLFATVKSFLQAVFEKKDLNIRIRPSYFPFVEPGVEIDMSCPFCKSGCSVCKKTNWIEICGAGLTHPNVLRFCSLDPKEYSGFAFGFGLTRLVMLKYGITDIRLLHANKISFLEQF